MPNNRSPLTGLNDPEAKVYSGQPDFDGAVENIVGNAVNSPIYAYNAYNNFGGPVSKDIKPIDTEAIFWGVGMADGLRNVPKSTKQVKNVGQFRSKLNNAQGNSWTAKDLEEQEPMGDRLYAVGQRADKNIRNLIGQKNIDYALGGKTVDKIGALPMHGRYR
jgi:hypothetical protein